MIAFTVEETSRAEIWIMNRDGSDPHAITNERDGEAWDAAWSPDGKEILFASDRAGGVQLFTMKPDGSDVQQVTNISGLRGRSDWSPREPMVASYVGPEWEREIYLFHLDGSANQQVTDGGNNLAPNFSPDGQWITFTSYRDNYRYDGGCEIYIMRLDTGEASRLTNNDYCDWQPSWGP